MVPHDAHEDRSTIGLLSIADKLGDEHYPAISRFYESYNTNRLLDTKCSVCRFLLSDGVLVLEQLDVQDARSFWQDVSAFAQTIGL